MRHRIFGSTHWIRDRWILWALGFALWKILLTTDFSFLVGGAPENSLSDLCSIVVGIQVEDLAPALQAWHGYRQEQKQATVQCRMEPGVGRGDPSGNPFSREEKHGNVAPHDAKADGATTDFGMTTTTTEPCTLLSLDCLCVQTRSWISLLRTVEISWRASHCQHWVLSRVKQQCPDTTASLWCRQSQVFSLQLWTFSFDPETGRATARGTTLLFRTGILLQCVLQAPIFLLFSVQSVQFIPFLLFCCAICLANWFLLYILPTSFLFVQRKIFCLLLIISSVHTCWCKLKPKCLIIKLPLCLGQGCLVESRLLFVFNLTITAQLNDLSAASLTRSKKSFVDSCLELHSIFVGGGFRPTRKWVDSFPGYNQWKWFRHNKAKEISRF